MRKILSIIIILAFNCQEKKVSDLNVLSEKIEELEIKDSVRYIIVLPEVGCQGCIQEGENFMIQHINNDEYFFILTKIKSLKILEYKTGISLLNVDNIFIDRKLLFDLKTSESIYPAIIKMDVGKTISVEYQSPENDAFSKLALRDLE